MPTVADLKKHLESYKDTDVITYDIWQVDDVIQQASDMNKDVTKEQAEEVLELVDHHKDANVGINWEVIRYYIDKIVE